MDTCLMQDCVVIACQGLTNNEAYLQRKKKTGISRRTDTYSRHIVHLGHRLANHTMHPTK